MIARQLLADLCASMERFPVVGLLGPRQVGKTTLAHELLKMPPKPAGYLDLERPSDRAKLQDPELYLRDQAGRLTILDEIQLWPDLFAVLRSLVDERRRAGEKSAQFLILGSASHALLKQSAESLAGRIVYHELRPFNLREIAAPGGRSQHTSAQRLRDRLWVRGGFPESYLADSDAGSFLWRESFITTYLQRDLPMLGTRTSAEWMRRFWTMLAHQQGGLFNAAELARSLEISSMTVGRHLDQLTELFLVRQLRPYFRNVGKRLVKSPKVYLRDCGMVHGLLNLQSLDAVLAHPVCGASWEGFVIENILAVAPRDCRPWFYRTGSGAEIDLVLEFPDETLMAIEIKRTLSPKVSRGFFLACDDLNIQRRFVLMPEGPAFPLDARTKAMGLTEFLDELKMSPQ